MTVLGPLAQEVEHLPFKQRVAGSSPARLTTPLTHLWSMPGCWPQAAANLPEVLKSNSSRSSSRPRTPPFHGGNRGSNPLRDAIKSITYKINSLAWLTHVQLMCWEFQVYQAKPLPISRASPRSPTSVIFIDLRFIIIDINCFDWQVIRFMEHLCLCGHDFQSWS
jgi:hypothetical protein